MKLNCKHGDLAVMVGGQGPANNPNRGKFVTVGKFLGFVEGWQGSDRWEVDADMIGTRGTIHRHAQDCYLRPIRNSNGEDEMLRLVGRPVGEPQAA